MARLRLIVLASLLVTGCEVFFGIKQSPSGSGGGAAGGGGAATGPEAGADAPSDQDAGNAADGPFCAAYPDAFLCADFDDGSFAAAWNNPNQTGTDIDSGLDPSVYVSAPASLRVTSQAATASPSCESSRVVAEFPAGATGIQVDFDFSGCPGVLPKVGDTLDFLNINCSPDGTSQNQYGIVNWGLHSGGYQVTLYGYDDASTGGAQTATLDAATPAPTGFTHVRIAATFGATGSATITVGNLPPVTRPTVNASCPGGHDKALLMGMFGCDQLVACAGHFDNVVVVLTP